MRCERLVQLGDKIVDTQILREYFCCDLSTCRGACCLEGESGAPVNAEEIIGLEEEYGQYAAGLTERGRRAIEMGGVAWRDADGEWVTTLAGGAECAFATAENGVYSCGIERAWNAGKCRVRKPLSCHLYPIRVGHSGQFTLLKFDDWDICQGAREYGQKLGLRVYQFLREPLIRAFGEEFYHDLEAAAARMAECCR